MLGLGSGLPAAPLAPATETERTRIRAVLARHGLLPAAVAPGPPARNVAEPR